MAGLEAVVQPAPVEDARWVEFGLELAVDAVQRRRQRRKYIKLGCSAYSTCGISYKYRSRPSAAAGRLTQPGGFRQRRPQPALTAVPFHQLRPGQVQYGSGLGDAQAPQRQARAGGRVGCAPPATCP